MCMCNYKNDRLYKKLCITNRKLVDGDFYEQIQRVTQIDVDYLILREKDLLESEYEIMAEKVIDICKQEHKKCILHSFVSVAERLQCPNIHLTMESFESLSNEMIKSFEMVGVSTHTLEEALRAEMLGASYITASHIFSTKCKEGLEPRGLDYLKEVTTSVNIPVYALGGIHPENIEQCIRAGADGVCMMSEYMEA